MKSRNLILIVLLSSIISVFLTVYLYTYKVGSINLSNKNEDWVNFASYFSGIIEPILAFLNLIVLTYLTIKLVRIEDERNQWTLQELARPYASLVFQNTEDTIDISIHNLGLGTMIITDYTIFNSKKTFKDFYDLITFIDSPELKFATLSPKVDSFTVHFNNNMGAAIGKDQSYTLCKLYFTEKNILNTEYVDYIRNQLNNYTVSVSYNDIYSRPIATLKEKLIFSPWTKMASININ